MILSVSCVSISEGALPKTSFLHHRQRILREILLLWHER